MPHLLLLEDDADIRLGLEQHLKREGFALSSFENGRDALKCISQSAAGQAPRLDVALLDLTLPDMDGLDVLRAIRADARYRTLPVVLVTARHEEIDRVLGLELGADDYIAKPFSPRELVARVKAVLRRFERPLPASPMKVGEIEIDPSAMTLTVRGSMVPTTATEFRLLDYFARHKGRVFSRDHLLDSVWRDTAYVTPRSVDVYVRRIREKIEPDPENPRYLKTVRGAGYRFEGPK